MNPSHPTELSPAAPQWGPQQIVANGAPFNYYRTPGTQGSGKPVLVLQHGFSDNGLCWGPVAQALAADYDVIMPDARGHGLSARMAPGARFDQAADLAAVMQALGVNRAVLAGHSMGAHIVADLAARFPERAAALVLEDPPWFLPRPEAEQRPRPAPEDSPLAKWLIGLRSKSLEQVQAECRQEHPTWPEAYVRAWCQGKLELDLAYLPWFGQNTGRWQTYVPDIQCPALLITADNSLGSIVTPEVARQAQAMNANIKVLNFPGVGHHVRFAAQAAYLQAVQTFLREVAGGAPKLNS